VCLASARFPAALYITMILSISDQDHVVPPDWKRHSRFKQSVAGRKRAGSPAHSQSHYTRGIADDNLMCILPVGTDTNYCILLQATESAKVSKVVVALLIQVLRHRKDFAIDIDAFRAHGCTWGRRLQHRTISNFCARLRASTAASSILAFCFWF